MPPKARASKHASDERHHSQDPDVLERKRQEQSAYVLQNCWRAKKIRLLCRKVRLLAASLFAEDFQDPEEAYQQLSAAPAEELQQKYDFDCLEELWKYWEPKKSTTRRRASLLAAEAGDVMADALKNMGGGPGQSGPRIYGSHRCTEKVVVVRTFCPGQIL